MGSKKHLIFSRLKACLSGQMKRLFIWLWVILAIPNVCRSKLMSLSGVYVCTILIILTHPQGWRWSSRPAVLILCRVTTSCKTIFEETLQVEKRILSAPLRSRIREIQSQQASCILIVNWTPYSITSYLCLVFHGCLVVPFLLMRKLFFPKLGMCIRW